MLEVLDMRRKKGERYRLRLLRGAKHRADHFRDAPHIGWLAERQLRLGRVEEARRTAMRAIEIGPAATITAYEVLLKILEEERNTDEAKALATSWCDVQPACPLAFEGLARLQWACDEAPEGALQTLEIGLERNGLYYSLNHLKAEILLELGRLPEAHAAADKAFAHAPDPQLPLIAETIRDIREQETRQADATGNCGNTSNVGVRRGLILEFPG